MLTAKLNVLRRAAHLAAVLDESKERFRLSRIRPQDAIGWHMQDGAIRHSTDGFFSIIGIENEFDSFALLYQPQSAVTGIITASFQGERCYLLQARAEPGCLNSAQFGPTVQSTPANFLRMHGGHSTPFIDKFLTADMVVDPREDTSQLDLGSRYLLKSKRSIILESCASKLECPPNFCWASPSAIVEAASRHAFLNIDLRSLLALAPWSHVLDSPELTPRSQEVRRSLAEPLRSEALGAVLKKCAARSVESCNVVPLDSLTNWERYEWGMREVDRKQGFHVNYFAVSASHREVTEWAQPLINSASTGAAVLACRERLGRIEVCVNCYQEIGHCRSAVHPTYLRYPGSNSEAPDWLADSTAKSWLSTVESDEGGRFFQDTTVYELKRVDDMTISQQSGDWITVSELRALLATSNTCSIQLRGLASLLLAAGDT